MFFQSTLYLGHFSMRTHSSTSFFFQVIYYFPIWPHHNSFRGRHCYFHFTVEEISSNRLCNLSKVTQLIRGRAGTRPTWACVPKQSCPTMYCSACFHQLDHEPLEDSGFVSLSLRSLALRWHIIKVKYLLCKYLLNVTFSVLHLSSLLCHSHFSWCI